MTNQKQIRAAFWETHPLADRKLYPAPGDKTTRDYCTDTRCAFVDFIDHMARTGQIPESLAARATL